MKRLIVGDIHGCYREFQELLKKANLSKNDEIISLGDIVDRGPDTPEVLHFFMNDSRTRTLSGNHEKKHILSFQGKIKPALSQRITRIQIGEDHYPDVIAWMEKLPYFIELPEAILVHGFFEPHIPLSSQEEEIIIGVMPGKKKLKERYDRPWYELYDGDKPLIVGHKDYLKTGKPLIYKDRVFCIDTDCCRGGSLTGLLLPGFKVISVPARKNYWDDMKDSYIYMKLSGASDERFAWKEIKILLAIATEQRNLLPKKVIKRVSELEKLLEEAEIKIMALFNYIIEENERIIETLQKELSYDNLSAKKQEAVYIKHTRKRPLADYLLRACKGELSLEALQKKFKGPAEFIEFFSINKIKL